MGRIIGKGGSTIKDIRDRTGTKIDAKDIDGDRCVFKITGSPRGVREAKSIIQDIADKDKGNDRGGGDRDRSRDRGGAGKETVVLDFPQSCAGRIIGSGGATIKSVRNDTGAFVKVEKGEERCEVHITGTPDEIDRAKELVHKYAEEGDGRGGGGGGGRKWNDWNSGRDRDQETETMEVPKSIVGRVIGKGGETIQRLQRDSGARIDVDANSGDPCRVTIKGNKNAVYDAMDMIKEIVDQGEKGKGGGGKGGRKNDRDDSRRRGNSRDSPRKRRDDHVSMWLGHEFGPELPGLVQKRIERETGATVEVRQVDSGHMLEISGRESAMREAEMIAEEAGARRGGPGSGPPMPPWGMPPPYGKGGPPPWGEWGPPPGYPGGYPGYPPWGWGPPPADGKGGAWDAPYGYAPEIANDRYQDYREAPARPKKKIDEDEL